LRRRNETVGNRRLFTGHYFDSETDLYYFGARYYDSVSGRFQSLDPANADERVPATRNGYSYARANPLSFVDPDGRQEVNPIFERIKRERDLEQFTRLMESRQQNTPSRSRVPVPTFDEDAFGASRSDEARFKREWSRSLQPPRAGIGGGRSISVWENEDERN